MSLLDAARLTDEEIVNLLLPIVTTLAEEARNKGLWYIVDWLAEAGAVLTSVDGTIDDASDALADILTEAGIERPKEGK